jgi:hypothetical protein
MPRFVILRHEFAAAQAGRAHWDLMFEQGSSLRTWAIASDPIAADGADARALADHRLAYLEYEGPISGDRGTVTRWDQGEYRLERDEGGQWIAALAGARMQGRITIERLDDAHSWRVSFAADPTRG